ncbi:unnamed protein product [Chironomus riparius]|uniref:Peptidase S1 domain-containing protein n=1 Tax=Chironomus riparius TaxID=315576 RepID=A0A9N9S8A5_9DIPT|nr:unnamed protein product [Chironomus riparius]
MQIILILTFTLISIVHGNQKPPACLMRPGIFNTNSNLNTNSDRNSRIAGGEVAAQGQFPWHVHMVLHDDLGLKICSGGLINPKWVLTSGTCIVCASSAILYLGVVDRLSFDVPWMTHVTNYDHFIVHEGYDIMNYEDPFADNIGLVFLQHGGEFLLENVNINVISLPIDYVGQDFVGIPASAAGFGAKDDPPTHSSQYLNYVVMNVINNAECNETYGGMMTESKLCTNTAGGTSTCHGDFGAPLSISSNNENTIIGVGSLRYFNGCTVNAPAVFTRVTAYLDWIQEKTSEEPEDMTNCTCDCICHTCPSIESSKVEL